MEYIDKIRSELRVKNEQLKDLRNDYKIIMENYKENLACKKDLRVKIKELRNQLKV